ncbi:MAG TPA: ABC transporter ATP-binding protein [Thermoplasmata archaeon]|nr:ABC transporter ATP-binding protein [Thermoplasmata archaeon]
MEALEARHVSKTYFGRRGRVDALRDVSIEIAKGRLLAFLGRNGAGKTTFIKIASTLLLPTEGEVRLFGEDVVRSPRKVREQIALVPQEGHPWFHLTPREHVEEYLRTRGAARESARARTAEIIEQMGLRPFAEEPSFRLSGGIQQRTLVAMILATRAPFLFLDEPTLGMDPFARRQVWEVIRRATREGSTVLLTTHYLDEAEQLSEDLAVIEGGRLLYRGSAEALRATIHREVRLQFSSGFSEEELGRYGKVFHDRDRFTLLTTRREATELTDVALRRGVAVNAGPVTLEEAFLELVGRGIEEEEA